ncbi:MAG: peroxiredoxin [Nitratireductor sp.]|nr:peroxiredoxin [Nitratireductor sp.]
MSEPSEGEKAPDFKLPTNGGGTFQLSAHKGRPVVLFFYPKDDTSGCTAEAVAFTAAKDEFDKIGVVVAGMSPDAVKSHDKFVAKHSLGVPLISDENQSALSAYGVWKEKSMYGKKYMGVERSTFLIGKDGKIAKAWRKVSVPGHVEEVLEAARKLS